MNHLFLMSAVFVIIRTLMKHAFIAILILLHTGFTFARAEGGISSGGGDGGEIIFDQIRSNLYSWVASDAAKKLKLGSVAYETYQARMLRYLAPHQVRIIFTDETPHVGEQQKTCRWQTNASPELPSITCSVARFQNLSKGDQYRLVHHEYAGIAGLEQPTDGSASDYSITSQIVGAFLPESIFNSSILHDQEFKVCSVSEMEIPEAASILMKESNFLHGHRCLFGMRNSARDFLIHRVSDTRNFTETLLRRVSESGKTDAFNLYQEAENLDRKFSKIFFQGQFSKICEEAGFSKAHLKLDAFKVDSVVSYSEYKTVESIFKNPETLWLALPDGSLQLISEAKCLH